MMKKLQVGVLAIAALWALSGVAAEASHWSFLPTRAQSALAFASSIVTNLATSFSSYPALTNLFTALGNFLNPAL